MLFWLCVNTGHSLLSPFRAVLAPASVSSNTCTDQHFTQYCRSRVLLTKELSYSSPLPLCYSALWDLATLASPDLPFFSTQGDHEISPEFPHPVLQSRNHFHTIIWEQLQGSLHLFPMSLGSLSFITWCSMHWVPFFFFFLGVFLSDFLVISG